METRGLALQPHLNHTDLDESGLSKFLTTHSEFSETSESYNSQKRISITKQAIRIYPENNSMAFPNKIVWRLFYYVRGMLQQPPTPTKLIQVPDSLIWL